MAISRFMDGEDGWCTEQPERSSVGKPNLIIWARGFGVRESQ